MAKSGSILITSFNESTCALILTSTFLASGHEGQQTAADVVIR